jgi:hypothetical protein
MPDMPEDPDKIELNWDIELNFELPVDKPKDAAPPPKPKIPARQILKEKFPRILNKIEILWGTMELHQYFLDTQFIDRESRQGFPPDVIEALGEINAEHEQLLMRNGLLRTDVWDLQFRNLKR